jgi:conjugal transfer pilus assembly protein TrbC
MGRRQGETLFRRRFRVLNLEEEKLLYVLIFSLLFAGESLAEDFQQPAEEGIAFAKEMTEQIDAEKFQKMTKDLEFLVKQLSEEGKKCKHCSSEIENIEIKNPKDGILIFVSFSMPKASLIELNKQAQKYNATLIMRGIYKNSFSEMRKKILEISPDGLSINIDPKAFEQYNIKQIPTFVLVENNKEIHRLAGNVSLDYAHEKLSEGR